ncbi:15120_t:CDS:2, partial [Dentiscutata erythropus]
MNSINITFPIGLMVCQNKTNNYLIDALYKKKSIGKKNVSNIEFGMELLSHKEENDYIIAIIKNLNNNVEEEIRCQYLVECDSVYSGVRKEISQTLKSSWALADVEIKHKLVRYNQATAFSLGPLVIIPLDARKNTYHIVIKIANEEDKHDTNNGVTHGLTNKKPITIDKLQKIFDERIAPIKMELKNL